MWLYISTCLVLFDVVKSIEVINQPTNDKNDTPKQTETIFADVIKNISRVNNVLQELINNYEQLQKIYQSQENVASVYSDSEIDEIFKSKKIKRTKNEEITKKRPNSDQFAVTQMFWSDHEEDDTVEDDSKDVNETEHITEKEKKSDIKNGKPKSLPTTLKTTTLKPLSSSESDSSDSSISKEKVKKPKKDLKTTESTLSVLISKQPNAEVIFIDTHKKPKQFHDKTKKPKEAKPKIEPDIQFADTKTRYSKVSHKKRVSPDLQNIQPNVGLNNTRKVKQIVYSESFAPKKIWNDIINNKPIQLEAHNEITLKKVNKTANMRSKRKSKAALVIRTKSKKNKHKEESISSDLDDVTEENETKALRQAYGDACLKMVVRKCHKACKQASKTACKEVHCKRISKSSFISNAKTGCIREFEGKPSAPDKIQKKPDKHRHRASQESPSDPAMDNFTRNNNGFVDLTRGRFAETCLPHLDHKESALRNNTPPLKNNPENFNILRDRFERACKKISSNKCNNACKYAYKKMCETHKCSKNKVKAFKKTCKKECKKAYQLNSKDSDGSDSDSHSDDSSDTDDTSSDD